MDIEYIIIIYLSVVLALIWAVINTCLITKIKVESEKRTDTEAEEIKQDENDTFVVSDRMSMVKLIGDRIAKGANAFLFQEYVVMLIFIFFFSIVVCVVVDVFGQKEKKFRMYATIAFIIGSLTSILCGWIGMAIAVKANFRTTFMAT